MAKRSNLERQSDLKVNEPLVEDEVPAISSVRLVLTKAVNLKIYGPVTGVEYIFNGAGSECVVDERDALIMLTKRNVKPCCSGSFSTPYFEKVG